jgi:hypothetical protein
MGPSRRSTHDFRAIVARAAELVPATSASASPSPRAAHGHPCLRPPRSGASGSSRPFARPARFLTLARRGRPTTSPPPRRRPGDRERFMDASSPTVDHMQRSLDYCRKTLDLRRPLARLIKQRSARPRYTHPIPAMPRVAALLFFPLISPRKPSARGPTLPQGRRIRPRHPPHPSPNTAAAATINQSENRIQRNPR